MTELSKPASRTLSDVVEVAIASTPRGEPLVPAVVLAVTAYIADRIDSGPTFPLAPSVISALVREMADA